MSEKDGGAAFPGVSADGRDEHVGMTLRDYFAGQALASVDRETWLAFCRDAAAMQRTPADECASNCYEIADAMLAARAKDIK